MKQKLFLFLLFSISFLNAEEFVLNDKVIKSEINEKIVKCKSFSIKLETEEFPFKYEGKVPSEFRINNYHGADNLIRREAFLMPEQLKISFPKSLESTVKKNRTYLPYKALCKNEKFVLFYTSGGNCKGCEVFIEFDVIEKKAVNPVNINYSKIREFYK